MHFSRRLFLRLAAGAVALSASSRITQAQAYPSRPVRLIVGLAAGGGQDIVARLMGQWLSDRLGRQFIIENRPGASGNLALEAVANAAPDGYTLALLGVNNAINASLYNKPGFEFLRDIVPVAGIMRVPLVMVVHPSFPATTVPEFIAYAKANPGKINMGSGGNGTSIQVSGELFKLMTTVEMLHVPYRGGALALRDLVGGQIQVMFDTMPECIELVRAGTLRPLAVTTATRSPVLPDLPTIGDFLPGYEFERMVRRRRAPQYAGRHRRQAQPGDQCGPRRSKAQGTACRSRRHSDRGFPRRFCKIRSRRCGEVGEGGQVRWGEGGVNSETLTPALRPGA